jgi:signal transduction histidine kinase
LLGLLAAGKKSNRRAFVDEDRQLIKIISRQVAIVILSSRLTSDLAVSQEMQQVSKLSSFLIQDLKSFISTLSSVIQNAATDFDNPQTRKDSLSTISGTINKMNCLMEKLSTLPNKLELIPTPTNINVVIEEAITRLRIDDMPTIRLLRLFEYVPQLNIDAGSFKKAIQNIIFNAVDSMPKGGTLTVKTSYQEGIGLSNGNYVQIMVRDTGSGMSNDFIQQRLFKPFQSNKHQGLGIGLFQSKAIVEAHGGQIQVQSQEGKGSTFTINLPVQRTNQAFQESVPKNGAGLKGTPP